MSCLGLTQPNRQKKTPPAFVRLPYIIQLYKRREREQEERSNRGSTDTSDCPAEIRDAAAAAETEVAIGLAHLLLLVAVNIGIESGVCVKKRQFNGVRMIRGYGSGVWFGGMIRGASTSVSFKSLNPQKKYMPIDRYIYIYDTYAINTSIINPR